MASFRVALRRGNLRTSGIFCAASACSAKIELTDWARIANSPRFTRMSAFLNGFVFPDLIIEFPDTVKKFPVNLIAGKRP